MNIYQLPALSTNYIYVLYDQASGTAAVVDPGSAAPVLAKLQQLKARLVAIFNTHRHNDHIGGNAALIAAYPDVVVYGGVVDKGRIPGQQVFLQDGDRVSFAGQSADVLHVPGHLDGHIAYYFAATDDLFSGDVVFSAGCGKLFDGPAALAVQSFDRLCQLPDATKIWCAHEYTLPNVEFALGVEPDNIELRAWAKRAAALRSRGAATIPTTIGHEKLVNPYWRTSSPAVQQFTQQQDPAAIVAELRRRKEQR
jgi:hydroxyacylglutathione hydrolase